MQREVKINGSFESAPSNFFKQHDIKSSIFEQAQLNYNLTTLNDIL